MASVEAVLFMARQPLGSRKLAQFAGLADGTKARTLVRALNRRYDAEGSAFRVEEVAGGFQLLTRPKFAPWLRRLHPLPVEVRLSAPAQETLAVVAYRQPVLRAEIEAIRGVQCGEILRQLIERDLVRIVGRSEELGRPLLYGTTVRFLQVFGLRHLEDLPQPHIMPITKRATQDLGETIADPETETSNYPHCSSKAKEETNMTILTATQTLAEEQDLLTEAETGGFPPNSADQKRAERSSSSMLTKTTTWRMKKTKTMKTTMSLGKRSTTTTLKTKTTTTMMKIGTKMKIGTRTRI